MFTVVENRVSITSVYLKAVADHRDLKVMQMAGGGSLFIFSWPTDRLVVEKKVENAHAHILSI